MKNKPIICGIVAVGPDNVIGKNGIMPWHCPADFYHFRKMTLLNPCIFGRKTFENLPHGPLQYRFNVVCSSKYKNEYIDNVFYASSIESAISECKNYDRIFICGGSQIYQFALNRDLIDVMYLTIIKNPILESKIKQNPDDYCRFPIDVKNFLASPKWVAKPILYSSNELPKNDPMTVCDFYECVRVRGV